MFFRTRVVPFHAFLQALCVLVFFVSLTRSAQAQPDSREPESLDVPGSAPAYYFPPRNRSAQRPVIVYVHGRGAYPREDCKKWASVATEFGWLLCPSGQQDEGNGARSWGNAWPVAQRVVDNALAGLRQKYGRKVQLQGNVLVGFSEGAYVAMNVGARESRVFNRWLILASTPRYWGPWGVDALQQNRQSLKRVYLLTGALDEVADESRDVQEVLKNHRVKSRLDLVDDLGHEVPASRMRQLYRGPLRWLVRAK